MIPETMPTSAFLAGLFTASCLFTLVGLLWLRAEAKAKRLTAALRGARDALAPFAGAARIRSWREYHAVFPLAATPPPSTTLPDIELAPLTVADLWKTADVHLHVRQALGEKIVVSPVKIRGWSAPSHIVDNAEE